MHCIGNTVKQKYVVFCCYTLGIRHSILTTVKTLNIGTPRPATVVVLNLKQFSFTMK